MFRKKEIQTDLNKIKRGFKINNILLKDSKGEIIWQNSFNLTEKIGKQDLPKEILDYKVITMEINFSSELDIDNLELVQDFYYDDKLIDSSRFSFGFVMPNSTNNWEQIIEVDPNLKILIEENGIKRGNLVANSIFFTKTNIISKNKTILYYI